MKCPAKTEAIGKGEIPDSVEAIKAGATDCLTKPLRTQELLAAVAAAIEKNFVGAYYLSGSRFPNLLKTSKSI
jgi:DNA-binding response OmpR family regulator